MRLYKEVQDEYSSLNVVSQYISYQQEGKNMKVRDSLQVENIGEEMLDEFVLYLNPGLIITQLTCGNGNIPYEREGQVCKIKLPVKKNEKVNLVMEYEGRIDEDNRLSGHR